MFSLARIPEPLKQGDPVNENWRSINDLVGWAREQQNRAEQLQLRLERLERKPDWGDGDLGDARWS